jgi:hypothetical protein
MAWMMAGSSSVSRSSSLTVEWCRPSRWFSAEHRVLTIARPNGQSEAQLQLA